MTAENQHIEIWQGDDFERTFTVTEDGAAKDLSGGTPHWGFARPNDETPLHDESDANITVTITDALAGEVTLRVDSPLTENLSGDYEHELAVDASGTVVTVATGTFTVNTDII